MQPPPRKTKISQHVRNVHAEQTTKLHAKHQTENDLLEDIRDFAKQRSSIEKTYAQALIKLAQDFYAKRKFAPTPDVKADESKESRSVYDVWKAILEETGKSGKARQATAEKLQTQVVDNAKIVKSQKTQLHKRCSEILNTLHEEVDVTIREFTKAKKSYIENETMAKEIREKAADAENRLKKGSVKIFQSKGTLEKNCAKLASKRDQCNRRSTFARNEYIINMSGANAHQTRYHSVDLPELIATLDGNVFEKFQEYFRALSSAEMATSAFVQNCFNKVLGDADMITREYDLECFLQENPAFTDIPHYNYEPVEGDQMKTVCLSNNLSLHFNKEARKWATRVARENKTIKDLEKTIAGVQTLINTTVKPPESTDNNQPSEVELKLEELKKNLRKSEISKLKAQAKLDSLRTTEIDVDEWLNSANETVAQEDDTISRTESHTSSNSGGSSGYGATADDFNRSDSFQDDSFDETFDEPYDSGSVSPMTPTTDTPQYPIQCVALYDYQAQRDDELTITQNESLEIIEESEGDGWIRGRNSAGDVGYFPESYIEIIRDTESLTAAPQFEPSSYTSNTSSITDMEVQAATVGMSGTESGAAVVCMARALYDYGGVSEEELSFSEGQLIKVTRKDENGIDDGFWEGEIDGKIGVFPSLVVEEVEGSNDMQTPDTPTSVVTPPDVCIPSSAQTIPRTKSLNMQYGRPMQSALETPSEKPRPASVNITEQHYSTHDKLPTPTYEHTRSAPQSPSQSRKPYRTAPPPPGPGSKKRVQPHDSSTDGSSANSQDDQTMNRRNGHPQLSQQIPEPIQEQEEHDDQQDGQQQETAAEEYSEQSYQEEQARLQQEEQQRLEEEQLRKLQEEEEQRRQEQLRKRERERQEEYEQQQKLQQEQQQKLLQEQQQQQRRDHQEKLQKEEQQRIYQEHQRKMQQREHLIKQKEMLQMQIQRHKEAQMRQQTVAAADSKQQHHYARQYSDGQLQTGSLDRRQTQQPGRQQGYHARSNQQQQYSPQSRQQLHRQHSLDGQGRGDTHHPREEHHYPREEQQYPRDDPGQGQEQQQQKQRQLTLV